MINGSNGIYDASCDVCGEGETREADSWRELMDGLKEDGWKTKKINDEWVNFCPECKGLNEQ